MKLLKKAKNKQAFAKVGIFGFQGSGKTHTTMQIAMGICDLTGNKTIAFYDTETGSDWWAGRVEGYEFFQVKTRSFKDLVETIREAESEGIGVLVIDSITHVSRDIIESYQRKKRVSRLQFHDWGPIKSQWGVYTDLFVNSKLHIIVCGRAGFEYEYQDDDRGKKELIKTGTKMKAEGEFGFEPGLVVEMELERISAQVGGDLVNVAHVLKDRSNTINGQSFRMPSFGSFKTHFDGLNLGGEHCGVDTSRATEDLFDESGRSEWEADKKARDIALDELKEELVKHFPGTTGQAKKAKGDVIEALFRTRSWERVSSGEFKAADVQWALLRARWFLGEIDADTRIDALQAGAADKDPNAAPKRIKELIDGNFEGPKEPSPSKIDEELKAGRIDYLRSILTERYQGKMGDVLLDMLEVRKKMPVDLETDPDLVEEIISELEGGGE
jgi:hypothetical protein